MDLFCELVLFAIQQKARDLGRRVGELRWAGLACLPPMAPASPEPADFVPVQNAETKSEDEQTLACSLCMKSTCPTALTSSPEGRTDSNFSGETLESSLDGASCPLIKLWDTFNPFYIHSKNSDCWESVFVTWHWLFQCSVPLQFLHRACAVSHILWGDEGAQCLAASVSLSPEKVGWGRCCETQQECSRDVPVLQSHKSSAGAGICERSHGKCCSHTEWASWERQWRELKWRKWVFLQIADSWKGF